MIANPHTISADRIIAQRKAMRQRKRPAHRGPYTRQDLLPGEMPTWKFAQNIRQMIQGGSFTLYKHNRPVALVTVQPINEMVLRSTECGSQQPVVGQ